MSAKRPDVLLLGGYGVFGHRIASALCQRAIHVIINGRRQAPAIALRNRLRHQHPNASVAVAVFDVSQDLSAQLAQLKPRVVVHTCGPFQGQDTQIAKAVIQAGCHYIDLADGRDYVQNMLALDAAAQARGVSAITAASTVPALSSAVLAQLRDRHGIQQFDQVRIGITPGQKTPRGLATTQAVLSYLGRRLAPWPGMRQTSYGWLGLHAQAYPTIGRRLMGHCEAADLDFFAAHFNIKSLSFAAGMESKLLHVLMWLAAGLVRLGLPLNLTKQADKLLRMSHWFDRLGTADGGMHVAIEGRNEQGDRIQRTWFLEVFDGQGPWVPAMPAVLMCEKIMRNQTTAGVVPCIELLTLDEYLGALPPKHHQSSWH
ncbi:saccharopine dehydrogenase family protein [Marinicella meishanensis]|uniref:saccharopine dehydrogenase family protein n=1 Tax=Marinicella meishanensis TaxID=2873263 RepID=UPI001CBB7E07|nr:saccharopine dehydrogenase NADP-binding domain-containing protein [Marinicella sp. NBU2979]